MTERRKIREQYRELIVLSEENQDSTLNTAEQIKGILRTANDLHENVTKPREHAADTELLYTLATSGLSAAKQTLGSRLNTPKDLVNALKCEYLPGWTPDESTNNQRLEEFNWEKLGAWAIDNFNTVCGVTTMFGPFQDLLPKERQVAQRRRREPLGQLVKPAEQENAKACATEQQETDKNMEEMLNVLLAPEQEKGVGLPLLVLNPKSFSQTVENIFTLSFLVREGRAKMESNPSGKGILVTAVLNKRSGQGEKEGPKAGTSQWISTFNMRDWKKMTEVIPASKCLMSHRTYDDFSNEIPATPSPTTNRSNKRVSALSAKDRNPNKRRASKQLFRT